MSDKIFKCPNHMKVTVKKDGGELALDEDCCTSMIILLKNDGNMATSFYGYHNEKVIKIMEKAQKKYFKSLKKRLKTESVEDDITIKAEDMPEDKKWDDSKKLKSDKSKKENNGNKKDVACKEVSKSNDNSDNVVPSIENYHNKEANYNAKKVSKTKDKKTSSSTNKSVNKETKK